MNSKVTYGKIEVVTQDELSIKLTEQDDKITEQREQFNQIIAEESKKMAELGREIDEIEQSFHEYMNAVFKLSCGAVAVICLMLVAFVVFF